MEFFSPLFHPGTWVSLAILTFLEIVLGIDNIIIISILAGKLPLPEQRKARTAGLSVALITRILLLLSINWLMGLQQPWITLLGRSMSGRDTILVAGGLFLIAKSTREIHEKVEGIQRREVLPKGQRLFSVVIQIVLLDIVFSLDSVITAVGMAEEISIMVIAVILAVAVMMFSARPISAFVNRHPTVKVLALSFLLLIGISLVGEGLGMHIPKGYIYFAMGFSVFVELINLRVRRVAAPVHLHEPYV